MLITGVLTLTWCTYMCLPFGEVCRQIWYNSRGVYLGQIIVKSTRFAKKKWVLFFQKWYTDGWEIRQNISILKVSFLRSGYHIHVQFWSPHPLLAYRPFSHCIDQAGLGAFTAKSVRKHYNPPPLSVMWMNFDSPNFPSFCSLSAIISFQTCSNKCILYVLSFHKCIKIKYKMVNMYGVFPD